MTTTETRPLHEIALEVLQDWDKPNYGALPYLEAMAYLAKVTDYFGHDSGASIVRYFLANASSWRGETARRVKAELNAMVKGKI